MNPRPFLGTEALASGRLTRRTLSNRHTAIYRNVYVPRGTELTAATRAQAAWLWSGRTATAAGLSAAALLGSEWIDADVPAELHRSNGKPVKGIIIHRQALTGDEICVARGVPATTPARTAFDLGRRGGLEEAVVRLDALARATRVQPSEVRAAATRHPERRGVVQLRRAVELMDGGAESPQETRTRLVLINGGLPRPQTQIVVHNSLNYPFARIDMGYRDFRVGVEYDGEQHWTNPRQRARDIDRHEELAALGWRIVRVSADMLRRRPHVILERTCTALRAAGAEWPVIARVLSVCVT
jgi:very-short-patch-repair endonuclease